MKLILKIILALIILLLLAGVILLNLLSAPTNFDAGKLDQGVFKIEEGEGVNAISQHLKEAGLIKNKFVFETFVWLKKVEGNFKAGEYKIDQAKNIIDLVNILTGKNFLTGDQKITFIEGWNNREIDAYLFEKGILKAGEFLDRVNLLTKKKVVEYDFLVDKPAGIDLEGYIFPDTYHITTTATAEE
ncbi:MAG: endolytic transglycosylase MltG, partial [Patescibacteria group bacterium]